MNLLCKKRPAWSRICISNWPKTKNFYTNLPNSTKIQQNYKKVLIYPQTTKILTKQPKMLQPLPKTNPQTCPKWPTPPKKLLKTVSQSKPSKTSQIRRQKFWTKKLQKLLKMWIIHISKVKMMTLRSKILQLLTTQKSTKCWQTNPRKKRSLRLKTMTLNFLIKSRFQANKRRQGREVRHPGLRLREEAFWSQLRNKTSIGEVSLKMMKKKIKRPAPSTNNNQKTVKNWPFNFQICWNLNQPRLMKRP